LANINPTEPVIAVTMNWGANDVAAMPTESAFETNYETIIDAVHAKWPTATIRIMRSWRRGFDTESDTLATWINVIQAARPFTVLGPDERIWLKAGDNGTTNTTDGVHYSTPGNIECAAQWKTALGY
jgi:lysophospholipase L1-like esterase